MGIRAAAALFAAVAMVPAWGGEPPPTLAELRSATYRGFSGVTTPVTLVDGHWEDEKNRVAVSLAGDFYLLGDLDGTPPDEAVVVLSENRGGSGTWSYLAVVGRRDGRLVNVATAHVGDRVQLRDVRIEKHRIVTDVVQAGPEDAMCCPGELATRTWEIDGSTLREIPGGGPTTRLSLAALGTGRWVLRSWRFSESAPASPEVTLQLQDARLVGSSGCNSYFAAVKPRDQPGDVGVSEPAGTRKMCPDAEMEVERRYLTQLGHVVKYGFLLGQLALTYTVDGRVDTMLFARK
jgi:heat shock protein HslJ